MNDMANFVYTTPAPAQLSALATLGSTSKRGSGTYLTFNKFGVFNYGQDKLEVEPEDEFAVNPNSFKSGFIAWNQKKVVGEVMKPLSEGAVDQEGLEDVQSENGWQAQLSVALKQVDGDGLDMEFKSSTHGGKQAIASIADDIATRASVSPDSCIPIINCVADSYDHKRYGKVFKPIFKVVGWMTPEGNIAERC